MSNEHPLSEPIRHRYPLDAAELEATPLGSVPGTFGGERSVARQRVADLAYGNPDS